MIWKTTTWAAAPMPWTPTDALRRAAARLLRGAAARLGRLARTLQAGLRRRAAPAPVPVLEFHAEAGAPEGALYVDGELVGRLEGVTRL